MEYKQVVGLRRSIRYYQPYRPVEREKIQAEFKNGVLEIRVPKKKEAAPKKIEIKGG